MPSNVAQRVLSAIASLTPSPSRSGPLGVVPPRAIDLDETVPIRLATSHQASHETLPMRCLRCQGAVERGTTPVRIERNGFKMTWQQVPAWVCQRCELAYFEPCEVENIRLAVCAMRGLTQG